MSKYAMKSLGSIAQYIRNGLSIKQEKQANGLPITRIETIANGVIDDSKVGYAGIEENTHNNWLLNEGDILISHINSTKHLGKCAIYHGKPKMLIHGMNLLGMRCNKKIAYPPYVYYMMSSRLFKNQIPKITKNSVNQSSFTVTNFKTLELPLPYPDDHKKSITEQQRIAAILDKADCIRKKRVESLCLSEEFLKSSFLEMFGNPACNPHKWPECDIGKYCEPVKNVTPSNKPNDEFVYIDISSVNCSSGEIESPQSLIGSNAPSRARQKIKEGDVLIATVRPNLRGTAYVPKIYHGQICSTGFSVLRPDNSNLTTEYLYSITRDMWFTNKLVSMTSGANYPAVRHKDVIGLIIPVPPIELQREYALIVNKKREFQKHLKDSLDEAEMLFNSLVQRAFRGEL